MEKKLNVRNDVVFKLFFLKEENRALLISFLESVLTLPSRIKCVEILNPNLPKSEVTEKSSILDLVVELEDKTKIDVEMQMEGSAGFRGRVLYYWAKLHQGQLKIGNQYEILKPTISICVLDYREFKENTCEVHTVFELREISQGFPYNSDLQLHFLELPKFEAWKAKNPLKAMPLNNWITFFRFSELDPTDSHVIELAKDPTMNEALKALEILSEDPTARELSEMREKTRINFQLVTGAAREEGIEIGMQQGRVNDIQLMARKGLSTQEIANLLDLIPSEVEQIISGERKN